MEFFSMPYGNGSIDLPMPDVLSHQVIYPPLDEEEADEGEIVAYGLAHLIGGQSLEEIFRPSQRVCVILSDMTRLWQRMWIYLPILIDHLNALGIPDEAITLLCATGTHRPQSPEEHAQLLGPLAQRFKLFDHDCHHDEMVYYGVTSYGTPVRINALAARADHIVLTGGITQHDLAGFGGGRKSILPGIAAYDSIMHNHGLALDACLKTLSHVDNNPIHEDMLEAARMVKPSFLLNVVVKNHRIVHAVAGDFQLAHERGQALHLAANAIELSAPADQLVVSAGGFPKDINFYQGTKAITNTIPLLKTRGKLFFFCQCLEGLGDEDMRHMFCHLQDTASRKAYLKADFTVAKYIAYSLSVLCDSYDLVLITDASPALFTRLNIGVYSPAELDNILPEMTDPTKKTYWIPESSSYFLLKSPDA